MAARLTVVIPALDEADNLARLLPQLLGAPRLVEQVIVSDGGSRDGSAALARRLGALVIEGAAGRGAQLGRGVAAAGPGWLWLLHADTALQPDWAAALSSCLATADPAKAHYGRLRFASPRWQARCAEALIRLRCALFALPYGDQSLLVLGALLAAAGGVPELRLMEDVALARRLGRRRLAAMKLVVITDAAAYERDGWLRRSAGNLWRLARFLAGGDAGRLAGGYQR